MPPADGTTPVAPASGYTLWFRARGARLWRVVFSGTEAECTAAIGLHGLAGDWLTLPSGRGANDGPKPRAK